MDLFLSPDFMKFFLPIAGGVIAWFVNERRKRAWEEYQRKEEKYKELIRTVKGFYVETQDTALKQAFIDQLNLCWLYCPDKVIQKGYVFINSVRATKISVDNEKELALGNFISSIREDLLSRKITRNTKLVGKDYEHIRPT
jgi:Pyruvate/2-oxoacid:ferredoxin oxidoreductase delta subunit